MENRNRVALICLAVLMACVLVVSGCGAESSLEQKETITVDVGTRESNEELFEEYIRKQMYSIGENKSDRKEAGGKTLPTVQQRLYNKLLVDIKKVASGERTSTVFTYDASEIYGQTTFTKDDLGVDSIKGPNGSLSEAVIKKLSDYLFFDFAFINDALLFNCPYELYWYDKTAGYKATYPEEWSCDDQQVSISGQQVTVWLYVSVNYSKNGQAYECDPKYGSSVKAAVSNAKKILDKYSGKSDKDRLLGYAKEICALVSYNNEAANGGAPYGNPSQLIWVFDGDESTNVICEGYSKAFQYLCDLSKFTGDIRVITVTGSMANWGHMWNIVRMNDGVNYLVDVTNLDSGYQLMLVKCDTGNYIDGYTFFVNGAQIFYKYNDATLNRYNPDELELGYKTPIQGVAIEAANFPDANFRNYLLEVADQIQDGILNQTEIAMLQTLNVRKRQIMSLTGIHHLYPNYLLASDNYLTSVDLSKNQDISILDLCSNMLTKLDLRSNSQLQQVACHSNALSELLLPESSTLNYLDCCQNQLSSIDLSHCPNLTVLGVNDNQLTSLDLSKTPLLTRLELAGNQVGKLDVTKLSDLTILAISNNPLTEINLTNCTKLEELWTSGTTVSLDLHNNKNLKFLACESEGLKELDLSANPLLTTLYVSGNQLTELNLENNIELTQLSCKQNNLSKLDLGHNTKLTCIQCSFSSGLNSLNISRCSQLEEIDCKWCALSSLDVTHNPNLKRLFCWGNNISEIDVSYCTAINELVKNTTPGMHNVYYGWGKDTNGDGSEDVYLYIDKSTSVRTDTGVIPGEQSNNPTPTPTPGQSENPTPTPVPSGQPTPTSTPNPSAVAVTGVKLNKTSVQLTEGETVTLTAAVAPSNATNREVAWSSSDSTVAKVDAKGKVTAAAYGKATITVTTEDGKKKATCTVTVDPKDKVAAYVVRCYRIILGREADKGGMNTWLNELNSGRKAASEIIDRFVNSPEYLNKNYNYGDSVDILYQAMLGRNADASGKANWVIKLESGQTLAHVINGFCFSKEFRGLCASYGIRAGFVNIPNTDTTAEGKIKAFVQRCYRIILDREADPSGMQTWYEQLSSGKKAAAEIIDRFVNSPEFSGKNYSHSDSVEILYKAMLGRDSDAAGKANWINKLDAGQPFAVVINGFCVSKEFTGICASYGIKPGSVNVQLSGMAEEEALSRLAYEAKEPITKKSEANPNRVEIINPSDTIDMNIGTAVQAVYINEEKAKEFIGRCYKVILGREASAAELESWIGQMVNGTKTPDQIARGFLFSNEFKAKNVGNEDLVKILYKVYMNRDADPEGLNTWTEKLDNGTSLNDLLNAFAKTGEFKKVVSEMSK